MLAISSDGTNSNNVLTTIGKLHINYMDDDVIIHCTDNPGRTTILRNNVKQKQKQESMNSFENAYFSCVNDLIIKCHKDGIEQLYVCVINKRADGIALLDKAMQMVLTSGIRVFPTTNLQSQPSSKTRRPVYDSSRRRYHKESYSKDVNDDSQNWRTNK